MTSPNSLSHSLKTGSISVLKDFVLSLFPGKVGQSKAKCLDVLHVLKKYNLSKKGTVIFSTSQQKEMNVFDMKSFPASF